MYTNPHISDKNFMWQFNKLYRIKLAIITSFLKITKTRVQGKFLMSVPQYQPERISSTPFCCSPYQLNPTNFFVLHYFFTQSVTLQQNLTHQHVFMYLEIKIHVKFLKFSCAHQFTKDTRQKSWYLGEILWLVLVITRSFVTWLKIRIF